jgi:hypothetical protein
MKWCTRKSLENIDETYFRRSQGKTYYVVFACVALVFGMLSFFIISAPKVDHVAALNLTFITPRSVDMERFPLEDVPLSMFEEKGGRDKIQHLQEAMSRACNLHPFSAVFGHNFGVPYNIFYLCKEDSMRINAHLKDFAKSGEQTCVEGYANMSRSMKRSDNILYSYLDATMLTRTDIYTDNPKKSCILYNAIGLLGGKWKSEKVL